MATVIAFLAFFVLLAAVSLSSVVADSRTYPRWRNQADVNHMNPRVG
ncbi:MAG TPA: hypothetical protein VKB69_05480 [Micromonosporaceae bacterium]|nr:hypothetical protein [Micromonosporaceae bacterium]